jgi:hypothetical protein
VAVRRITAKGESIEARTTLFLEEVSDIRETLKDSWPRGKYDVFRDSVDIVLNFWSRVGICKVDRLKTAFRQTVEDLSSPRPRMLNEDSAEYSELELLDS